jgi:hypothetical protein
MIGSLDFRLVDLEAPRAKEHKIVLPNGLLNHLLCLLPSDLWKIPCVFRATREPINDTKSHTTSGTCAGNTRHLAIITKRSDALESLQYDAKLELTNAILACSTAARMRSSLELYLSTAMGWI